MNALVEVHIVTYAQKEYIAQAIESVLAQQTSFKFKIKIGDDGSRDGTQDIITAYQKKYPDLIELFINPENRGARSPERIGVKLLENITCRYVALLDGDDYWCDPLKLQKQVDALEKNTECVACHHWHKITVRNKEGVFEERETSKTEDDGYLAIEKSDVGQIFNFRMRPQSRTLMFRNVFTKQTIPNWFYSYQWTIPEFQNCWSAQCS